MSNIKMETKDNLELISRTHGEPGFCRICLVVKKRIAPLATQLDSEQLIQVFTSATGIDIPANDQLPQQICHHCKRILLELHIFRKKCLQSDKILKSVILKDIKSEQVHSRCSETSEVKYENDCSEADDDIKSEEDISKPDEPTTTSNNNKDLISNENDYESRDNSEEQLLVIPLQEVTEDKQYMQERKLHSCTECEQSFRSAKSLRIHTRVQHVQSSLSCARAGCAESFQCDKDLRLHHALHDHTPPWTCVECGKQFLVKYKFRRHTLRHMDSKQHKCDQCDKAFSEHYALVRHLRSHSTCPQPRNYACHLCDKRYTQSTGLKAHLLTHSGARPCVCATCGKTFPSNRLLVSHARCHTDHKPHACDVCQRTFRHVSTLRAHTRTHTGERPYVCACCGKCFLQNSNLTLHMRTHTGEKPYSCSMCPRQFSARSSLTIHERRHAGHKPNVCNICGKGFVGADIAVHMRRHTQSGPHACGTCPATFHTPAALRDHTNVHAGIKPFECALCQKKMTTKSHLIKHLKTHETKKDQQIKQDIGNKMADVIPECSEEVVIAQEETQHIVENNDTIILTIPIEPTDLIDDRGLEGNGFNTNVNECVNLVELSEEQVNGTAMNSDGFSVVKLYQVDQSLVQISSCGDQVSITSTLAANFE